MELRAEEFYEFMRKREQIRLNRLAGEPWPWTEDRILQEYSFTNVKREHDRTSILYREGLYEGHDDAPFEQVMINAATARFFGRAEFVCHYIGWQETFDVDFLLSRVQIAKKEGQSVWTNAYMITAGGQSLPKDQIVVRQYLAMLWAKMDVLYVAFKRAHAWQHLMDAMRRVDGFGGTGFMSKEVLLDTMFTHVWPSIGGRHVPSDWSTWCPAGPGARRGVARVMGTAYDERVPEKLALEVMLELYEKRFAMWPVEWVSLDLHDIQFQLCEFDKYERARLGQGRPKKTYKRR
ncbi:MAG TPA: nucleotide kinase domain-containing protein [Nitrospira sp.]|nr:nucleotide kinase domain-containing protein [Nitrospira sp.]